MRRVKQRVVLLLIVAAPLSITQAQDNNIYACVKRGHSPDLNDVRMESNH